MEGDTVLQIRKEQNDALAEYMVSNFVDRSAGHLASIWPEKCQAMGKLALHKSIRNGIEFASKDGINREVDVVLYLNLLFAFDLEFKSRLEVPWARDILKNKKLQGGEKIDKLYQRAEIEIAKLVE